MWILKDATYNVKVVYTFTFFYFAAQSILFQQVISGYIFVLTNSNQPVGIVKGIQGISQLLFTLPAAFLADRSRRDTVLKISACIGLVGAALTLIAIEESYLWMIYVSFGLWGLFAAFQSPAMEALFADSVPHGKRSFPFMINYNISNFAMVLGPVLCIVLFLHYGNVWEIAELKPVLLLGTVLAAIASVILFRFNDDYALTEEHSSNPYTVDPAHGEVPLRTPTITGSDVELKYDYSDVEEELRAGDDVDKASARAPNEQSSLISPVIDIEKDGKAVPTESRFLCLTSKHIPHLVFLTDFIICNGAGMTVNFFPLFFMQEYQLTPVQMSVLFAVEPLWVMVLSYLSQRLSKVVGRVPIIVVTRFIATFCLLWMAFAKPLPLQIALYLVRSGTMRCSQPLRRSVLMDHVPKETRARWNALEGISVFTWSGSAVLGGYLVDLYDYRTCFFITSFVYVFGVSVELLLLPLTKHAVEK